MYICGVWVIFQGQNLQKGLFWHIAAQDCKKGTNELSKDMFD